MKTENTACACECRNRFGFTVLGSGSKGNATVIHGRDGDILLDAGFSARELTRRMLLREIDPTGIRAMLITHEHQDHIQGCRVFANNYGLPVYMTPAVYAAMNRKKNLPENCIMLEAGSAFELCGITVEPFTVAHDVAEAVAYTFRCGGEKLGYATDLGSVSLLVSAKMSGCDAIVLESNYDTKMLLASARAESLKRRIMSRHGHLSNELALETMSSILAPQTRHVIFAHLSSECNDAASVKEHLGRKLEDLNRTDIFYEVARQDEPLETLWINA